MSSALFPRDPREARACATPSIPRVGTNDGHGDGWTIYAGTSPKICRELVWPDDRGMRAAPTRRHVRGGTGRAARAQMKAGPLMGLESPVGAGRRLARLGGDLEPGAAAEGDGGAHRRGDAGPACAITPLPSSAPAGRRWRSMFPSPGRPDLAPCRGASWLPDAVAAKGISGSTPTPGVAPAGPCRLPPLVAAARRVGASFLAAWEPTWAVDHLTRKSFTAPVLLGAARLAQGNALPLFIFRRDDDTLLGAITLDNIRRGPAQSATLGYCYRRGPCAARLHARSDEAVVHFAFRGQDLSRVEAACLPENVASRGVLEKAGFIVRGRGAKLPADQRALAQSRALCPSAPRPARAAPTSAAWPAPTGGTECPTSPQTRHPPSALRCVEPGPVYLEDRWPLARVGGRDRAPATSRRCGRPAPVQRTARRSPLRRRHRAGGRATGRHRGRRR